MAESISGTNWQPKGPRYSHCLQEGAHHGCHWSVRSQQPS